MNYIPKHDFHYMCDTHTRLHNKGEYEARCCVCNGMQGCLDPMKESDFEAMKKKFAEERDTVKRQEHPEFFQDE